MCPFPIHCGNFMALYFVASKPNSRQGNLWQDQWLRTEGQLPWLHPASLPLWWSFVPRHTCRTMHKASPRPQHPHTKLCPSVFFPVNALCLYVSLSPFPFLLPLPLFSLPTLRGPFPPSLATSHFLCHEINKGWMYLVWVALAFSTAESPGTHALFYSLKYKGTQNNTSKTILLLSYIHLNTAITLHISLLLSK